jgi:hypothetical protein
MKRMLLMICILSFCITPAHGQAGVGKKYDTRDLFVCKSTKEPARGAPSSSQITDYMKCKAEKTGGCCIWLMENVQVETGKSRPFSSWSDVGNQDIDNSQPVYPIRGTYDNYQCYPPGSSGGACPRRARIVGLRRRLLLPASATRQLSVTGAAL